MLEVVPALPRLRLDRNPVSRVPLNGPVARVVDEHTVALCHALCQLVEASEEVPPRGLRVVQLDDFAESVIVAQRPRHGLCVVHGAPELPFLRVVTVDADD